MKLAVIVTVLTIGCAVSLTSANAAVVASNGFTAEADGYSFANYGNDPPVRNLTKTDMVKLFGKGVCVKGSDPCTLIPEAQDWKESLSAEMDGGHCFGLATTSQLFFEGKGKPPTPEPFGSATVPGLKLVGNAALQSHIGYAFALQAIPSVAHTATALSPLGVFRLLRKSLAPGTARYLLTIYDDGGGHAITPTAVETLANGKRRIAVYDNNWPGQTRYVNIDDQTNSWTYDLGPNTEWGGNATDDSLELMDPRPGFGHQPCFLCPAKGKPSTGKTVELRVRPEQRSGRHGAMEVTDRRGNRTGCGPHGCRNEIPGAELRQIASGAPDWKTNSPPVIELPTHRSYRVALGSTSKLGQVHEDLTVTGRGFSVGVSDVAIRKGEQDTIRIRRGLKSVAFDNDARGTESPTVVLTSSNANTGKYFRAELTPAGINPDASLSVGFDPLEGKITIENRGGARIEKATLHVELYTAGGIEEKQAELKLKRGKAKKLTL